MERILKNLMERKKGLDDQARNSTGEKRASLKGKADGIGIAILMIRADQRLKGIPVERIDPDSINVNFPDD